jgi:hypothetical protein
MRISALRSPRAWSSCSFWVKKSPGGNSMIRKLAKEASTTITRIYPSRRMMYESTATSYAKFKSLIQDYLPTTEINGQSLLSQTVSIDLSGFDTHSL